MKFSTKHTILFLSTCALMQGAYASGYHFGTQSVTAQGTANSSAAEADDASTLFYNPAGLTKLEGNQISAAINLVKPDVKYENASATYTGGGNVPGSTSGKIAKDLKIAPHLYGAYHLNDQVTVGVGMYIPFGSGTDYEQDSVSRYNLNKTELTTFAVEPAVAFKINDKHSVAVGAIAQHADVKLRKYADWGSRLGASGQADGAGNVKLDDWGFGYHLAWMWDVNDRARVGVNYRSKVEHNLKGDAEWSAVGPVAQRFRPAIQATVAQGGSGYVPQEDASLDIVTPESLSVHGMYRATPKLNLFGDVTWTRHSRFNEAHLKFANPKRTLSGALSNETVIYPNWRNTYKVGLGASYQYNEPLQLRGGIAFDQSPVRSADERLVTLPDANRLWFSLGAKYDFNRQHSIDVAYSHIHINNASTRTQGGTTYVDSNVRSHASYKSSANILGLQYNYRF